MNKNKLLQEFGRYILVGGTAFIVDMSLLYIFKNYVFHDFTYWGVYFSTAIGFIGGLVYNYILSLTFVFTSAKEQNKGKNVGAFVVFLLIGVSGLLLTELGMYAGVQLIGIHYLITKVLVAGFVLIWNYGLRKILLFK
ncbi:MAG TPA: GtrA family protein [Clostridia bacterium]|nr:GtrA family protein [Clostridia bacterium]